MAYALRIQIGKMAISSLVLTLQKPKHPILYAIASDPRIHIGNDKHQCVPLIAETKNVKESEQLIEQLQHLDGVDFVHVVRIYFEDEFQEI